ncbi:hypothetical protein FGADI_5415 [Fusarium gaditjirri]|uniref:Uncharacterized protein n=1 Tax=Fusarium gaditjirri TaxID=282569 RepID=A0A8H4TA45_9HYPO|nr:hypothetical protein FGADI_5415 [Fusarium gaditjirri]
MNPWDIMCQSLNCNVEANHWTRCTCPYPSPPDESSSTHASPNSVSYDDQEPTTSSPAALESHQSGGAPGLAVSFCYGEWSNHFDGFHPQMDYASPNLLIDSEPQDTQLRDHTPPPTAGQSSKSASPSRTEDHPMTKDAKDIRSAAEELEDLCLADRFLVKCMLNDMEWKTIHKEYNETWEAKSEGALRAQMSRIKDENPAIRALLE